MDTSFLEKAIESSWDKCSKILTSSASNTYHLSTDVYNHYSLGDLLLDIYCQEAAFHTTSLNHLFEAVDNDYFKDMGLTFSKKTIYRNINYFVKDLRQSNHFSNTYAAASSAIH